MVFLEGEHHLPRDFSLTNISSLSLENYFEDAVTISCSDDGKLVFENIETILINGVNMEDCYGNNITYANYVALTDVVVQGTSPVSNETSFLNETETVYSNETVFYLLAIEYLDVNSCRFSFNAAKELQHFSCTVLSVTDSNMQIYRSVFDQNLAESAEDIGCVLCCQSCNITITDSTFANNTALHGGILTSTLLILDSTIAIGNSSFTGNQAKTGGAVYCQNSTVAASETIFANNYAMDSGSVAYITQSSFTLDFSSLNDNVCGGKDASGAIFTFEDNRVTASHTEFLHNSALGENGSAGVLALSSVNSTAKFANCTFIGNMATTSGGVMSIYSDASLFINNCTFSNNSANKTDKTAGGGVITAESGATIIISSSDFTQNSAFNGGCVSIIDDSSTFKLSDCTFSKNSADKTAGVGGVLTAESGATIIISSSDFTQNSAFNGGCVSIFNDSSTFIISDSTFSNNNATRAGGVINAENGVMISISSSNLTQNSAKSGGCIYCIGIENISVADSNIFEDNTAIYGGAFTITSSELYIDGCNDRVKFVRNSAQHGGALNIISDSIAHIKCTDFEYNRADVNCSSSDWLFKSYSRDCRGGAILVRTYTNIFLMDTNFRENSVFGKGGALFSSQFASIEITGDLIVEQNSADNGTVYITGSKVQLMGNVSFIDNEQSFFFHYSDINMTTENVFHCSGGRSDNSEGGAITAFGSKLTVFGSMEIKNNQAIYGGGIKLTNSDVEASGELVLQNNSAYKGGAVNAYNSRIYIKAHAEFQDNKATEEGGAIYAVSSSIEYYSTSKFVTFSNNTAELGGAIYFDRTSSQYIIKVKAECKNEEWYCTNDWMVLTFAHNSAIEKGGAFYVDDKGATTCYDESSETIYHECFIQTIAVYERANDWEADDFNYANIDFVNNTAGCQGSLLYGGLLDRCAVNKYAELMNEYSPSPLEYFTDLIINHTTPLSNTELASGPVRVCLCDGNNASNNCSNTQNIRAKRGVPFNVSLYAVDQVYTPVASKIVAYISGNTTYSHLGKDQSEQDAYDTCTPLTFSVFTTGSVELSLFADGPCPDNTISRAKVFIEIEPNCPPGFELSNSSLECACDSNFSRYFSECDINTKSIVRHGHFWMSGIILDNSSIKIIVHDNCPYDYCLPPTADNVSIDLSNCENGSDVQCAFNRTGVLCGSCNYKEGYSLTLGSSRCLKCSHYYLLLIIPFGLAGIAIVVLMMACNLTVASGTLNGLLFYANILIANKVTFFPFQNTSVLTVFISWLGLNLGIPTCFYNGMDSFVKMWVQITFELYLIALMVAIIILGRYVKVANFYHNHNLRPVDTLATITMLSYEKLSRNIFSLVAFTTIKYPSETKIVWLFDPTTGYFEIKRTSLLIVAIVIILTGIIFNFILLFNKILISRCKSEYFKQFMLSFYAPLKTNHQYWIGLLLLVRNVSYITSEFLNASNTPKYSLHVIFSLVVGLLTLKFVYLGIPSMALAKLFRRSSKSPLDVSIKERDEDSDEGIGPAREKRTSESQGNHENGAVYMSSYLDLLETLFLVNLAVFTYFTLYFSDEDKGQDALFYVSSSIVLMFFIGILLYHIYTFSGIFSLLKKLRKPNDHEEERMILATSGEQYGTISTSHTEL